MDLDPDTLAAIKSDAYAELGLELGWSDDDDGTRDLKHDIVNALVPFVAASVEAATREAIAVEMEDEARIANRSFSIATFAKAAEIARAFRSAVPEGSEK